MSVLIKGMEMPSSCNGCLFGHWSNRYQVVFCELLNFKEYPADYTGYKAKRLDKCPLVELPEHHGRLIDADALVPDIVHDWNGYTVPNDDYSWKCIHNAQTIVEAEGDE